MHIFGVTWGEVGCENICVFQDKVDPTQHLVWDVETFVALAEMVDATQHLGWYVETFLALEHMGLGWCGV